jgi:putative methionine-R-sulfoxide reductase with GAF domain
MPIDPSLLAQTIATLNGLDPDRDLASTLHQAVAAAKKLFAVDAVGVMLADHDGTLRRASASDLRARTLEGNQESFSAGPCRQAFETGQPAVMHDVTLEPRWGEITSAFATLRIRSGLSVPLQLHGHPVGTLDVYAVTPGGWDATEVSALQAYAGVVTSLLGMAAAAEISGRVAQVDMGALDAEVAAFLERAPGADGGIGQKLSLLLLGFLATEVVPLVNRLAELGIDPTPLFTAASGILRLYADTLERPSLPGDGQARPRR